MKNKLSLITYTNLGYLEMTENLILSAKKNAPGLKLQVFCIDNESKAILKKHNNVVIKDFENVFLEESEFVDFKDKKFGLMMGYKYEMIYKSLLDNEFTLYIDGDIVIKRDFTEYMLNKIENKDLLVQNDLNPKKPEKENLCAGFMFIRSNKKTLKFFNPKNVNMKRMSKLRHHDQTYLINNRRKFNYLKLDLVLFPNVPLYFRYNDSLNPYIIHFNYLVGNHEKIDKMKETNQWYV